MGDATQEVVRSEVRDRVAIWTLARPERSNALSAAVMDRLGELAGEVERDRAVRAVVLTGEGPKAFCAGADLKERRGMDDDAVRAFLLRYDDVFGAIDRLPCPVIAAINGVAFGGGLELALSCDLRVMDPEARVGLTETSLGIIPGAGGTQRLPRVIGTARAKQMVLLAERLDAQQALSIGLVHRVAEAPGGALDAALQWADHFRHGAPIAMAAALDALDHALDMPLREGLQYERRCYERTLVSTDRLEALDAFANKRKPVFKGE